MNACAPTPLWGRWPNTSATEARPSNPPMAALGVDRDGRREHGQRGSRPRHRIRQILRRSRHDRLRRRRPSPRLPRRREDRHRPHPGAHRRRRRLRHRLPPRAQSATRSCAASTSACLDLRRRRGERPPRRHGRAEASGRRGRRQLRRRAHQPDPHRLHALRRPGPRDPREACRPTRLERQRRRQAMRGEYDAGLRPLLRPSGAGLRRRDHELRRRRRPPSPKQPDSPLQTTARRLARPTGPPGCRRVRDTATGEVSPTGRCTTARRSPPGATIQGPAIIAEDETSTLVGPGWTGRSSAATATSR